MAEMILMGAWLLLLFVVMVLFTFAAILGSKVLLGIALIWGIGGAICIVVVGAHTGVYSGW